MIKMCFGKIRICYPENKTTGHLMKLYHEKTNSISEGHGISYSSLAYHKPKGTVLTGNKIGQHGPSKGKHLSCQNTRIDQTFYSPMMPDKKIVLVRIPSDLTHIPLILGQETFPIADTFVQKKTNRGRPAFESVSRQYEGQEEPLKVQKIDYQKDWSKKYSLNKNSSGKESIHGSFSS